MNFEKLQIVRDTIAKKPEHFNMINFLDTIGNNVKMPDCASEYLTTCGTVACIAGYTVAIFEPNHCRFYISKTARSILKLSENAANYIFFGKWSLNNLSDISVEETLWYLDGVLKTKDIRWNKKSRKYWPMVGGCWNCLLLSNNEE